MRPPSIIRITVPRKEPPARLALQDAARGLTRFVGVFEQRFRPLLLRSETGLSKPQHLVLAALARRRRLLARDLSRLIAMDPGQLSRVLSSLEYDGLVLRGEGADARQQPLTLTPRGSAALRQSRSAALAQAAEALRGLSPEERHDLIEALQRAQVLLGKTTSK